MGRWINPDLLLEFCNIGIAAGLLLGAMLVLRPLLLRLLTAQQRAWLGVLVWYPAAWPAFFQLTCIFHLLPVTFRDFITPRTSISGVSNEIPAYLPSTYRGAGEYAIVLPWGEVLWVDLTDGMLLALVLIWLAGVVLLCLRLWSQSKQLKALGRQGELLEPDDPLLAGLPMGKDERLIAVRLCRGLPTSFAYELGERINGYKYNMVYLQKELSPRRRELVLRHEQNHFRLHHSWMKGWACVTLVLYWWNPIVWEAYYYFCRDLELACDEKTLRELEGPEQRKQYAQTLVELAAGKMLWSEPLAFGECGAIPRVKAAVAWRKPKKWVRVGKWCAFILVLLFFVGGPKNMPYRPQEMIQYWQQEDVEVKLTRFWIPAERWLRGEQDGWVTLLAQDTQGIWHESRYRWEPRKETFYGDGLWGDLEEEPDLTGFQPGLW